MDDLKSWIKKNNGTQSVSFLFHLFVDIWAFVLKPGYLYNRPLGGSIQLIKSNSLCFV